MQLRAIFFRICPVFLLLSLAGCGKFFVSDTTPPGGSGSYLYEANAVAGTVTGFSIGTSGISNTSNSPYSLGVPPNAMAVTPSGSYVYVGSSTGGALYGYSVASSGALSLLNNSNALITGVSPVALSVDPSGQWLIAVDASPAAYVFSIDSSTGLLTQQGSALNFSIAGSPNRIVFTPNNGLVYVSLGTGGVAICTFNSNTGVLTQTNQVLKPKATANADQGLAVDPAGQYLFAAETGANAVRVLTIASSGALTEVSGSPFKTGLGPTGVLVDSTGSYVYVTNRTDGTVSAFSLSDTTGALTAISGSPFTTGSTPVDLTEDTTDTYLGVACLGGSPDLQVFTIGSSTSTTPGALTSFATAKASTATGALAIVAAD
jgi:6-phosphogluconolactonase (cycloisomerase 2 family)